MKRVLITLLCSAALGGCSSFKLGAFCYVPAVGGQCVVAVSPASTPAAPTEEVQ